MYVCVYTYMHIYIYRERETHSSGVITNRKSYSIMSDRRPYKYVTFGGILRVGPPREEYEHS